MGGSVSIPALGVSSEGAPVVDRAATAGGPGRADFSASDVPPTPDVPPTADGTPAPDGTSVDGTPAADERRSGKEKEDEAAQVDAPGEQGDLPAAVPPGADAAGGRPNGGRRVIRAGRDLPAAIAVGIALGAVILVPLFTLYPIWVAVVSTAVAVGTYEVVRALHVAGMSVPLVPLAAGAVAMPIAAYAAGTNGLVLALAATTIVSIGVRAIRDPAGRPADPPGPAGIGGPADIGGDARLRDIVACAFTSAYVGFPAGFATLLTSAPDGHWRTIAFLGTVVASDIGGYTAGVLSGGRHKLAPTVSPGKSWEGFAGSVLACVIVGAVLMAWPLGAQIWQGALLGAAVAATATVGDLGESLLKRDIGIKDMGSLLPGHGGIMDRLDSLLCTAPVAWLLITAFLG
ncbi:phosphatidate cytidylyltransferase [Parafrankia elaeagni]|uniref:phosphatidate cytidylyltransferase n=1 Tax=Parafrankia elaeagni TaxID=222534 RepID=UPI000550EF62|nr:phosphatidate cytidylyltransferase [Parafrankia elaeagni]